MHIRSYSLTVGSMSHLLLNNDSFVDIFLHSNIIIDKKKRKEMFFKCIDTRYSLFLVLVKIQLDFLGLINDASLWKNVKLSSTV